MNNPDDQAMHPNACQEFPRTERQQRKRVMATSVWGRVVRIEGSRRYQIIEYAGQGMQRQMLACGTSEGLGCCAIGAQSSPAWVPLRVYRPALPAPRI